MTNILLVKGENIGKIAQNHLIMSIILVLSKSLGFKTYHNNDKPTL